MKNFPAFMRIDQNKINPSSQYTKNIEGYVYDGVEGSQMAIWSCHEAHKTREHSHEFDEYMVCVFGQYTVYMDNKEFILNPGDELYIPTGLVHHGECIADTRTIHAFGGKRAERVKF